MKFALLALALVGMLAPNVEARPRRKVVRTVAKKTCKVVNGIRICR